MINTLRIIVCSLGFSLLLSACGGGGGGGGGAISHAPVLSAISNISMVAGNSQTITLTATDPDNDAVSFSATGGSVATVSTSVTRNSLTITAAPDYVTLLPLKITVTASDGNGGTNSKTFNISVTAPTALPTKVVVKLATSGTTPPGLNIGGLQTDISYATNKGLSITDNDVITSGKASGATLFPNATVPGIVGLGSVTLGGAGFLVGEFATLTFTITPSNFPLASDFTVVPGSTLIAASDDAATDISGQISIIIESVTFQ